MACRYAAPGPHKQEGMAAAAAHHGGVIVHAVHAGGCIDQVQQRRVVHVRHLLAPATARQSSRHGSADEGWGNGSRRRRLQLAPRGGPRRLAAQGSSPSPAHVQSVRMEPSSCCHRALPAGSAAWSGELSSAGTGCTCCRLVLLDRSLLRTDSPAHAPMRWAVHSRTATATCREAIVACRADGDACKPPGQLGAFR